MKGEWIRGYELREKIGEGGFGAVYRAFQPSVGREVAIKVILPKYANHPDFIRRFETEAQLVARLEHPFIIPLYDYWREPGGAYLVMRHLRGGSLKDRLERDGPLANDAALRLVDQIAAALSVAHRHGVIHRDLKPGNILLDDDDNAVLTDFGIAKDISGPHQMTREDLMVGSPAYLSPEQIKAETVAPQADVYSMGIVIFEVLTGSHPFKDFNTAQVINKHLHDPLPPLLALRPDLPEAVNQVVQKATAKPAVDRYRGASALVTAFRQAMTTLETSDATVSISPAGLSPEAITNPYKGLRAFQEADAADFFGRESLTQRLLTRLGEDDPLARFLAVVGPSGSGKSSVVRAGLIPALRSGALPGSDRWFIADMLPGTHPLDELEIALTRLAASPNLNLMPVLRQDERGLLRAVRRVLPTEDAQLLLVIDQFEETFILAENTADATHFINSLNIAATDPRTPLRIIVTLRADFYDRPLMMPYFCELVRQRTEVVTPMSASDIERAIVAPAERVGVQVEAGLVAAIVAEVNEQPGALPMLQFALTELFDQCDNRALTLAAYHNLGGIKGVLAQRADTVFYSQLPSAQRDAARQVFLRLVTLGEGAEDTRRRARLSELLSMGGEVVSSVIDAFDQSRLLTFDRDPLTREPTVEVAHEALLREWGQLRTWLDESRHDIRQQRLLAAAALQWNEAERDQSYLLRGSRLAQVEDWARVGDLALTHDEQDFLHASLDARRQHDTRQRRIRNIIVAGAVSIALVMSLLALFALRLERQATDARQASDANADRALMQQQVAEQRAAESHSLTLVNAAQLARNQDDPFLALALGIEANRMDGPPTEAQQQLYEVAFASRARRRFTGHTDIVSDVAFTPDGTMALSASRDATLILWDVATGAIIRRFTGHSGPIWAVAITPDGQTAISASNDETLIVWGYSNGRGDFARWQATLAPIWDVALSPDGALAVSGSSDDSVILWDVATGEILQRFTGHTGPVYTVAFSPDGGVVFSGSADQTVIAWEVATGAEWRRYVGHTDARAGHCSSARWVNAGLGCR